MQLFCSVSVWMHVKCAFAFRSVNSRGCNDPLSIRLDFIAELTSILKLDEIKWSLTLIPMAAIATERRGCQIFQVTPLQAQLRSILAMAGDSR